MDKLTADIAVAVAALLTAGRQESRSRSQHAVDRSPQSWLLPWLGPFRHAYIDTGINFHMYARESHSRIVAVVVVCICAITILLAAYVKSVLLKLCTAV